MKRKRENKESFIILFREKTKNLENNEKEEKKQIFLCLIMKRKRENKERL